MLKSIRAKLSFWYFLVLCIVLFIYNVALYFNLSKTLYSNIDSSLWFIAETETASMMDSPDGEAHIHEVDPQVVSTQEVIYKYVQLLNKNGEIVNKSKNLGQDHLPFSKKIFELSLKGEVVFETVPTKSKGILRIISMPVIEKNQVVYILQIGTSLAYIQKILNEFLLQIIMKSLFALLLTGIGGWFLAKQTLKPVKNVTETAKEISIQNLSRRLESNFKNDEIGQLIEVLNEMLNRLENAFKIQQRFIADASHELRSPLAAIKGTIEVLLRHKRSQEEYEQTLNISLEEINRLTRIVNNLLILAKTDSKIEKLNLQKISLDEPICDVINQIKSIADNKKIRIEFNIKEKIEHQIDVDKFKQLIFNLLDNAVKYTPSGGFVEINLAQNNDEVIVKVIDDGIGISSNDIAYIFDRFYRIRYASHENESHGSGLGLSICKWIMEEHHGHIKVDSEQGKGTIFTMVFPK